ncbi:hypothetical protein [Acinetobacter baumannii]|uniref:hypothetical protein n=1 Tax=Acinetobacter baumannii TaxID=470 RepID=UPI00148EFC59
MCTRYALDVALDFALNAALDVALLEFGAHYALEVAHLTCKCLSLISVIKP